VKVFLNAATSTDSSGDVGSNHGTEGILFHSSDTVQFANGWSTIHPSGGTGHGNFFPDLTISAVDGEHFTDLTFDAQMQNFGGPNDAEHLVVTTFDNGVDAGSHIFTTLPHDADLRFDVLNPAGLTAVELSAQLGSGIKEVKQIQVSGFTGVTVVPEPSTFALMALGVVGVGLAGYRRTRRTRPGAIA
jgi:hypothetical protein